MKLKFSRNTFVSLLVLTVFSCQLNQLEKLEIAPWEPVLAIPILDADLTLEDVISKVDSNREITVDDEGLLTFIYFHKDTTPGFGVMFELPTLNFPFTVSSPVVGPTVAGQSLNFPQQNVNAVFAFDNDAELSVVNLSSGTLSISLSSDLRQDLNLKVSIPSLTKSGTALEIPLNIDYTGSVPVGASSGTIDLSGYEMDLSGPPTNSLRLVVSGTITGTGQAIQASEKLSFDLGIENLGWKSIEGYLGQLDLSKFLEADTAVNIKLFENRFEGDIFLTDPSFKMKIGNSIGLPISVIIDSLAGKANREQIIFFEGSGVDSLKNWDLAYPTKQDILSFSGLKSSERGLNAQNSNVQVVFNPAPRELQFKANIKTNKNGKAVNYVTDTGKVYLDASATIPMKGRIENYESRDTFKLKWPVEENVQYVKFYTEGLNGFPVDVWMQAYFCDSRQNYKPIDSLFVTGSTTTIRGTVSSVDALNNLIQAADVSPTTGRVNTTTYAMKETIMTGERYERIRDTANAIIMRAWFRTTEGGTKEISLYQDYNVKFKIGVLTQIKSEF